MADGTLANQTVERETMRAITLRLVPFLMLCYFFNFLDRSNIGVASLQIRPQLGLSAAAYGLGGSLFFVEYFLFEVPSNLLRARTVVKSRLVDLARSPSMWGLAIVCVASSAASASLLVWQPQLIKRFGLTNFQTGLVNSIPYGFAVALMMFWGVRSDRTGERRWHRAAPLLVIATGLMVVAFSTGSLAVTVALLSCVLVGYSSFKGPFWAFTASTLSPAEAAAGIAGINAFSNLVGGGMVSLVGLVQDATHTYALALLSIVVLALLGAGIVLTIASQSSAALAAGVSQAG